MLSRLIQCSRFTLTKGSQGAGIARLSISAQKCLVNLYLTRHEVPKRNFVSIFRFAPTTYASSSHKTLQKPRNSSHSPENEQLIFESNLGHTLLPRFAWATTLLFGIGAVMVAFLALREDVGDIRTRILSKKASKEEKQQVEYDHFQILQRRKLSGLDTSTVQRFMIGAIPVCLVGVLLLIVKRSGSRLVSRMYLLPRNRVRIECSNPWKSRKGAKEASQIHAIDAIIPGTSVTADASQMFQPIQVLVNPCDPNSTLKTYYVPAGGNLKEKLEIGSLQIMERISFGNTSRSDARTGTVSSNDIDITDSRNDVAFRRPAHKE